MFIPNTYEFFWTTSPEDFCKRMAAEYKKFWQGERDRKAGKLALAHELYHYFLHGDRGSVVFSSKESFKNLDPPEPKALPT